MIFHVSISNTYFLAPHVSGQAHSGLLVRDGAYRNTLIRSFPHIHHILEAESALDFNLSVKRPESTGCVGNARGIQCGQGNLVREQHVFARWKRQPAAVIASSRP